MAWAKLETTEVEVRVTPDVTARCRASTINGIWAALVAVSGEAGRPVRLTKTGFPTEEDALKAAIDEAEVVRMGFESGAVDMGRLSEARALGLAWL